MRPASATGPAAVLLVALLLGREARAEAPEARVALDAKDAPVAEIVRVLAEAGGFQVVFDPGVACKLTLRIQQASWRTVLDASLAACSLAFEEGGDVLRVARVSRLREEAEARRRLDAERAARPQGRLALFRLSHARAEQIAPLLDRAIAPSGRVSYDARTNTLLVRY
jgi:type II secretory pathway component HofQ